jgi:signal transduction histidine kinase
MLNSGGDLRQILSEVLGLIRESTAFDAVGLRVRNGDDYPYYEQNGFSDEFLQEEKSLCARGLDGAIIRDADGRAILECTCGVVLSGRTDPSLPCFTSSGSFWTNVSAELLAIAPAADPRTNPRNRCIHAGYQSIGLFPVRSGEEIIGLMQLNDRREGRFNPEIIRFLESLAGNIGLALKRKQAEEALQKSAEELTRSNRELNQFSSVVSHDLQEPLRTVRGFVQLLEKKYAKQLDAEADSFIEYAVDGTKRMETLIKDLLAYSRVGTRSKEPVPIDAGAALRQALDNLRASIQEAGAEVTQGQLPTVRADPSQLPQLFQNLLGNAIKFRGQAPPQIHVEACRDGHCWLFSVRDNGIGIDPRLHTEVFEVFRRLHTQKQYEGTGIGLAICKKIVDRHGGRIWVESQPGEGATFSFTLPMSEGDSRYDRPEGDNPR